MQEADVTYCSVAIHTQVKTHESRYNELCSSNDALWVIYVTDRQSCHCIPANKIFIRHWKVADINQKREY